VITRAVCPTNNVSAALKLFFFGDFSMNAKNWFFRRFSAAALLTMAVFCGNAHATAYTVWGTTLTIYGQSTAESTAHMISSSKGIFNGGAHPWCGNRAYILPTDTGLYATALSAALAGKSVNLIYEDAAPQKNISGHISFGCKVISIWF
jgi:hypothetical protein